MGNGLLKGLERAWFLTYYRSVNAMEAFSRIRKDGYRGILVANDYDALMYQICHYKAARAKKALTGSMVISAWSPGMTKKEARGAGTKESNEMLAGMRNQAIAARKKLWGPPES